MSGVREIGEPEPPDEHGRYACTCALCEEEFAPVPEHDEDDEAES